MKLNHQSSTTLRLLLLGAMLTGCEGDLEYRPSAESAGPTALAVDEASQATISCAAADAGAKWGVDGEIGIVGDADDELAPSSALGANAGDPCSPGGEGTFPWARCETRRGLRCDPPPPRLADAPSRCACPAGAPFEKGVCSGTADAGTQEGADADAGGQDVGPERTYPSTALGSKPGDRCAPNAFNLNWALCDARRGLACKRPAPDPRRQDAVAVCACPESSTFAEGVCTKG